MSAQPQTEPSVAVVDDEPEIGDIIERTLGKNYNVDIYTSAQQIFDALEDRQRYDVILCDLFMPQVSGRQVYDTIAEQWPGQADHLVFISGISEDTARQDILEGLDVPVLEKPFQLQDLRDTVGRTVEAH